MAEDSRILELVEQALESNLTPEEVCAQCPELVADVRACLNECRDLDSTIERLFPSTPAPGLRGPRLKQGAPLPKISGYEVLGVVGRGGNGVIYRARHLRLNRVVALKMLLSGEFASRAELTRFRREAEAVAALQHPNIVQIYDVGDVDGRPYFTMEFVAGGTLAQKLSGVPQPARYCASLTQTLALAIHEAHLAGIVHRDLKPGNILLTLGGTPKISDFGLARQLEDENLTLPGARAGTPSYMAPEQVIAKPESVGAPADVYALGATFYELLTGRPPFRGETATETQRQVVDEEPAAPSRLNAKVPRDLETICLKCLQKEPNRRYENAAALADDLQRFAEGRPINARPVGRVERAWRWGRRNPTMAALLLTALALVGLASGGGTWFLQQRSRHNAQLRSDVSTALTQATSLHEAFHFNEARALLEQARQRLGPTGPHVLRLQVDQELANLELVENLDKARLRTASPLEAGFSTFKAESLEAESMYEQALAKAGLKGPGSDGKAAAARVRASATRAEIVAALDDWASITADPARRAWLLAVVRGADPEPMRNRLRQPELWDDGARLTKVVKELPADGLSPQLTTALGRVLLNDQRRTALGEVLLKNQGEALALLSAAQARHPQDFWLNFELGWALYVSGRSDEGLGFYRVALALRPEAATHCGVGEALGALGRWDEAISQFRQAIEIDPNSAMAHFSLAWALRVKGPQDEANIQYQEAIRLDPKLKPLGPQPAPRASVREPVALANVRGTERAGWQRLWSDVVAVVAGDPVEQREENVAHRKWAQAADGYAQALKRTPTDDGHFWFEYAAVSELSGDRSSYRNACAHMIEAFGKNGGPRAYHVARACTLAPDAVADILVPARLAENELRVNAGQFWSLTEQGALAYRAGKFKESAPFFEQSLQASSKPGAAVVNWLWLALANQRLGKTDKARRWLEKAQTWLDQFHDGLPPRAEQDLGLHLHNWLEASVLRGEAEAMISPPASTAPAH